MSPDEKECPYCAEIIKAKAVKCKHCNTILTDEKPPKTIIKDNKKIINSVIIAAICIVLLPIFIILCGFSLHLKAKKDLENCERNIKNISTAIGMFATDNNFSVPEKLEELTSSNNDGYMRIIPVCPSCRKPYLYQKLSETSFVVECGEIGAHWLTFKVPKGRYPFYSYDEKSSDSAPSLILNQ